MVVVGNVSLIVFPHAAVYQQFQSEIAVKLNNI